MRRTQKQPWTPALLTTGVAIVLLGMLHLLSSPTLTLSAPAPKECSDGKDNDGDGYIDWPADKSCKNKNGRSEGTPAPPSHIFENTFNTDPTGLYTLSELQNDWNSPPWENGIAEGHVSIIDGAEAYEGKSLRVLYPEGWSQTGRGAQWILYFNEVYDELYVSYRIKFGDGFDFVKGGKLPGLAGGASNTGGNKPDGTDGWSGRMMWRTGGSIVQYVYHPDQPTIYGEDFPWNKYFTPNVWHTVETRIVMNTPGAYDGIIQSWFDGSLALDEQGIRFRDVSSFSIDSVRFETFFGGGDPTWAPTKDEYVYFDDFVVSETRIAQ
jgi:hypothetical protein